MIESLFPTPIYYDFVADLVKVFVIAMAMARGHLLSHLLKLKFVENFGHRFFQRVPQLNPMFNQSKSSWSRLLGQGSLKLHQQFCLAPIVGSYFYDLSFSSNACDYMGASILYPTPLKNMKKKSRPAKSFRMIFSTRKHFSSSDLADLAALPIVSLCCCF